MLSALFLAAAAAAGAPDHVLDVESRVGKFETFYAHAMERKLDGDARFKLWQDEDGIAAVPPGPDGDAMARRLLDAAWPRYPALVPRLPALTKAAQDDARGTFDKINAVLETAGVPIHSRVVLYAGQFDDNAYTVPPMDGRPATLLASVENVNLEVVMAHELAHTVHIQLAGVKNSFGAPVGETVFAEGLAMRVSQAVAPGLPETAYTQMPQDKDWLVQCRAKQDAILAGIAADLDKSGREIAMKYTFGQGNTGMQREAYCAGWIVTGKLLASGKSLAELARVPEDKMVETVRAALTSR